MNMFNRKTVIVCAAAACAVPALFAGSAQAAASWDAFVIRNSNVGDVAPTVVQNSNNEVTATVALGGQKIGFGTHYFDDQTLSNVQHFSYTREDSGTKIPYLNIWITDGTHSALIAPIIGAKDNGGYDSNTAVNGQDLQSLGFNLYDNSNGTNYDWLVAGAQRDDGPNSMLHADGTPILLSEIGALQVFGGPSSTPYKSGSSGDLDTGAPINGTGFNIIFGDSQGESNNPIPYHLSNIAVPEPSSLAIFVGLGGLALLSRRTRRKIA